MVVKVKNYEIKKTNKFISVIPAKNNQRYKKYFNIVNSNFKNNENLENIWNELSIQLFNFFGKKYMQWTLSPIKTQAKNILKSILKREIKPNYIYYYHMLSLDSHRIMLKNATSILCGEKNYRSLKKIKKLIKNYCYF